MTASPVNSRRDDRIGWTASIGLHVLLLLFMIWMTIELPPFLLDFTPVDFVPLSEIEEIDASTLESVDSGAPIVELPRRPMLDETSPLLKLPDRARPPITAVIPKDRPEDIRPEPAQPGRRLMLPPDAAGRGERPAPAPLPVESSWLQGERQQAMASKLAGDEMFSISWNGPDRKKIAGELPKFPAGVNRAATVRLAFDVAPDGSVTFASPTTKGVPELEKVSLDALRSWRFNALDPSLPQIKQRGEITFIFTLK